MSTGSEIFATVPQKDYLELTEHDKPDYQKIAGFLEFRKEDIAKATGVSLGSIRYDEKIPIELRDRLREWMTLLNLVAGHFRGDAKKTTLWFMTPNPLLGGITPREMVRFGRYRKLFKFVANAIAENRA